MRHSRPCGPVALPFQPQTEDFTARAPAGQSSCWGKTEAKPRERFRKEVLMNIEIEYCVPCGYLPRATDAQTRLLEQFGNRIDSVALKTGRKGVFTFRANGEQIYAKPELFDIEAIAARVAALLPAPELDGVQTEGRELLMGKAH